MGELINDLLDLSRINQTEFVVQRIDMGVIAREIATDLLEQVPQRQVEIEIGDDLVILGDLHLIKIAINNLLDNAIKFTGKQEKAHITMGSTVVNNEKVYFIRDNGPGFDMAHIDKLFKPFHRLHSSREYPGTGIGLSIVKRVITRHGGRIWPEAAVNQGATFYFTFATDYPADEKVR